MMIDRVQIRTNEFINPDGSFRMVDQIEIHVMDAWYRRDVRSERDVYLAQRLADDAGVEMNDWRDGVGVPEPLSEEDQEEFGRSFDIFAE